MIRAFFFFLEVGSNSHNLPCQQQWQRQHHYQRPDQHHRPYHCTNSATRTSAAAETFSPPQWATASLAIRTATAATAAPTTNKSTTKPQHHTHQRHMGPIEPWSRDNSPGQGGRILLQVCQPVLPYVKSSVFLNWETCPKILWATAFTTSMHPCKLANKNKVEPKPFQLHAWKSSTPELYFLPTMWMALTGQPSGGGTNPIGSKPLHVPTNGHSPEARKVTFLHHFVALHLYRTKLPWWLRFISRVSTCTLLTIIYNNFI